MGSKMKIDAFLTVFIFNRAAKWEDVADREGCLLGFAIWRLAKLGAGCYFIQLLGYV